MNNPYAAAMSGEGSARNIDTLLSSERAHSESGGSLGRFETEKSAPLLIDWMRELGLRLACAESLTGGMIASTLVGVPGASDVLNGGVVTYTDAMKTKVLGVDADLLDEKTAYSPECAMSMAAGALQLFDADVAVSSTGVAGPESDLGVPAGTGFLGCATPYTMQVWPITVPGERTRQEIREAFTRGAIALVLRTLIHDRDKGHYE
ncbi:MAG: CinA family protein [Mobiluncus sp.]|uniref:CinA family protein n=1 Tax=Mobiluncus sp. TaxID=47293 RepID=UPI002584DE17|nr:CinA family protein [Mobiluncus sp.]MCI6583600.1 CinA family protein [Mobiluncus sp.]